MIEEDPEPVERENKAPQKEDSLFNTEEEEKFKFTTTFKKPSFKTLECSES
jgi:hypothetical protein